VTKSASRKRSLFGLGALTMLAALAAGCATGPTYTYAQQKDSASVEGAIAPIQRTVDYGSCSIQIIRIDGFSANFDASRPGANWSFTVPSHPLYLAPGKHAITLDIAEVDTDIGEIGHGRIGTVGELDTGSQPILSVELAASHVYRFTANLGGSAINVSLWDETGGTAGRFLVASWTVDSSGSYLENSFAPVHKR